ncbi:MAG: hypothetical protein ACI92I_000448 [Acidimicrobiales bacterium]|jgi:hypothetical protein
MSIKRNVILFLTCLTFLALFLTFVYSNSVLTRQLNTFSATGFHNKIDKKLEWIHSITLVDPIFSFPATDLDKLNIHLEGLTDDKDVFAQMYSEQEDMETVTRLLYPEVFLSSISQTESLRRLFIENPTTQTADNYHTHLINMIETYIEHIDALTVFYQAETGNTNQYTFWGGTTNIETLLNSLKTLKISTESQKNKVSMRISCMKNWRISCENITLLLKEKIDSIQIKTNSTSSVKTRLSSSTRSIAGEYRKKYAPYEHELTHTNQHYYVLTDNWCAPQKGELVFSIFPRGETALEYFDVEMVDNMYFHDTQKSDRPFLQLLYQNSVLFESQGITPYSCLDSGKMYNTVMTMEHIRSYLEDNSIVDRLPETHLDTEPNMQNTLRNMESRIVNGEILHQVELAEYLSTLFILTQHFSSSTLNMEVLSLINIYTTNSSNTDQMLLWLRDANLAYNLSIKATGYIHTPNLLELFLIRTYTPMLLFTFNTSVVPNEISFYDKGRPAYTAQAIGLRAYLGDIEHSIPPEKIAPLLELSSSIYKR